MNEYKFVGTRQDEKGNVLTTTDYVYAYDESEARNKYISEYKPIPFQWEFLGKV